MKKSIALVDIRLFLYMHYHRKESLLNVLNTLYAVSPLSKFTKMFFVYDNNKNPYLKKIYPDYKENRTTLREKQTDAEKARYKQYSKEYNAFTEVTKYFGTNITVEGEADTMIEVLADKFTRDGENVYIFSGDGDFNCLLTKPNLWQVTPRGEVLDEEGVYDKKGVTPEQLRISKNLAGDLKDNIKGIKNLGEIKNKKTGNRLRKILQSSDNINNILNTVQEYVDTGKYGMALPQDYGVSSVKELYEFNSKLNKAFTYADLTEEHQKELAKQVNVKQVKWNKDDFDFLCWKNFGSGVHLSNDTLQFFNIKESI